MNYKEWVNTFMAPAYGVGQVTLFFLWLIVAISIIRVNGVPLSDLSIKIGAFIGGIGTYYYGVRKYEQKLR